MNTRTLILCLATLFSVASARAATLYVAAASTNPVPPYADWPTAAATIQDAVDAALAGDEIVVTNGVYQTGARAVYGMSNRVAVTKPVTVRSVNGPDVTKIVGYQVPTRMNGPAAVRCVYLTNGAVLAGFTLTNGATQISHDEGSGEYMTASGGGVWCESQSAVVTNCVLAGNSAYGHGGGAYDGTLNNCTLTGNWVEFQGGGAYGGTLNNCTLTGNVAGDSGGGALGSTLNNCTLRDNSALETNGGGGGAAGCTLNNCTLMGNSAVYLGGGTLGGILNNCTLTGNSAYGAGGAYGGTLNNCTLTGNSAAEYGGGAYYSTLKNCIVYYNTAGGTVQNYESDPWASMTLNHCCTTPLPASGIGNITNAPLFVDTNGWSNLRLQSNSPCINAGNNAYVTTSTDLDGRPRIVGGVVDMGAYEYQGPGTGEFMGWLQQSGLPTDGSADFTDPDADGANNFQEYRGGTDPTNPLSVLRLRAPAPSGSDVAVTWQSVAGVSYALEWSTNLGAVPAFQPLATHLPGQAGLTTFTHTNGAAASPRFYRVRVP